MTFPESEMILKLLNKGAWRIGKKVQQGLVKVRVYVSRNLTVSFEKLAADFLETTRIRFLDLLKGFL